MSFLQNLLSQFTSNPKRLFLLDGLGTVLTALLLGLVLANMERHFGMPPKVLYALASLACLFGLYSFSCSAFLKVGFRPYLLAIAIANQAYCSLTLGLIWYFYHNLTKLGIAYFLLEIAIIITLVSIELNVLKTLKTKSLNT